jgi:hypothetical protein
MAIVGTDNHFQNIGRKKKHDFLKSQAAKKVKHVMPET